MSRPHKGRSFITGPDVVENFQLESSEPDPGEFVLECGEIVVVPGADFGDGLLPASPLFQVVKEFTDLFQVPGSFAVVVPTPTCDEVIDFL
ncbi:hypothetical protein MYX78_03920 [Acidobacteria bacterium AH-259-G07]|nr:hypothetical protein [Acidobacteria bacterium AH-259-G07]